MSTSETTIRVELCAPPDTRLQAPVPSCGTGRCAGIFPYDGTPDPNTLIEELLREYAGVWRALAAYDRGEVTA